MNVVKLRLSIHISYFNEQISVLFDLVSNYSKLGSIELHLGYTSTRFIRNMLKTLFFQKLVSD